MLLIDLPDIAIHLEDADKLPPVNTVGVAEPICRGQASPTHPIARRYRAQRIAVSHNV